MNSIEEYQNLVEILKNALKFYANEENYGSPNGGFTRIAMDNGSQAKFALGKIKEVTEGTEKMEAEYVKHLTEAVDSDEDVRETFEKMIKEFKNLNNGNKDI